MIYEKCETCGEFGWVASHQCPPTWEVEIDENGLKYTVHALEASEAAEKAVERWERDSADYSVVSGNDVAVTVTDTDGAIWRFEVSGESVPVYSAHETF